MGSFIWKPQPSKPGKPPVLLVPHGTTGIPTITDSKGNVHQGHFINDLEGSRQFGFDPGLIGEPDLTVNFGDQSGKISNGGQSFEGNSLSDWKPRTKGSYTGDPNFAPGEIGYGSIPANILSMFPEAVLAQYKNIKAAKYTPTDIMKFAESFGNFNRQELGKNFSQASDLALKTLDTELEGLKNFVPAASALKRNEISLDNQFNQAQRTSQVNTVLPHAAGDLESQRQRATSFASGNIPDSVQNSAFELGIRSTAADRAAAGGFGASSSVSRKASDLLSAGERVNLSKYGDQLLSSNLGQTANLYLAPTEYSNAGSQINVNPSLSGSQLTQSNFDKINAATGVSTNTALQTTIGQNQYQTNLHQATNQFNATNRLNVSEFNATAQNNFALSKFGYEAGYANAVASANQVDINTNFQLQQQQMMAQLMQQYMSQSQNSGLFGSIFSGLGNILGGSGGISSLTGKNSGGGVPDVLNGGGGSRPDLPIGPQTSDFPDFSNLTGGGGSSGGKGGGGKGGGGDSLLSDVSFGLF